MSRRCLFASILILCALVSGAQEPSRASIVYAEGEDFQVVSSGRVSRYNVFADDVYGIELAAGDQISTDDGTYLELLLGDGKSILRISENTTVTIASSASGSETSLRVAYGRVRAIVRALATDEQYEMRTATSVAAVRGTDFAVESVISRAGVVVDNIVCLDGAVEVGKLASEREAPLSGAAAEQAVAGQTSTVEDLVPSIDWDREVTERVLVSAGYATSIIAKPATSNRGAPDEPQPIEVVAIGVELRAVFETDTFKSDVESLVGDRGHTEAAVEAAVRSTPITPGVTPIFIAPSDLPTAQTTWQLRERGVFSVDLLAGGGSYGAAGPRFALLKNRLHVGVLVGATDADGTKPVAMPRVSLLPINRRIAPSLSAFGHIVTDFRNLTVSAALSPGLEVRFNRLLRSVYIENLLFVNLVPWTGLLFVYRPAIGVTL